MTVNITFNFTKFTLTGLDKILASVTCCRTIENLDEIPSGNENEHFFHVKIL